MSEHTELPWEIIWQGSASFTIGIRNTQIVVAQATIERDMNSHYGPTRDEAQANAEFIVLACNSHKALLGICQKISKASKTGTSITEYLGGLEAAIEKGKPK